jgi:L-amino acid N-acyltransferase YncA
MDFKEGKVMSQLQFKELTQDDLTHVKEIYDYYVLNSTATFHTEPVSVEELAEYIFIGHSRYKSYLIMWNDKVIGYCYFSYYKKRQAYDRTAEVTLYIRKEFHGNQFGTQTLVFLEDIASKSGLKNLLGVISGDNLASIKLFEKCGYTKCAHFKRVGEKFGKILDVVVYQKELQQTSEN